MLKVFIKLTLIIFAITYLGPTNAGQNPAGLELFDGLWGWEPEKAATCRKNPHKITFSKDRKKAYLEFMNSKDKNGNIIKNITVYSVHNIGRNSITMSIDNEKRLDKNGNPVVWDLVLLSDKEYKWQRHDWAFYQFTASVIKCNHVNQ